MAKAPKLAPGIFLLVPLGDGTYGYGRSLEFPDMAFYDLRTDAPLHDLAAIAARPVLFRISVRLLGGHDRWPKLGRAKLEGEVTRPVTYFRQDDEGGDCRVSDSEGRQSILPPEECQGLERSAVWDPHHVEARLLDHFEGRPNETVERFRPRLD